MAGQELLQFHQWLLSDEVRTSTYQKAVPAVVKAGDIVADIGAGSGILSFFACLAGARKVYAIEPTGAIEIARELCARNGFTDRVEFFREFSQNIVLPEQVDVVVSDTGGSFGLDGGMVGILQDARKRFLKPAGQIVPRRLSLLVAPVELEHEAKLNVWKAHRYGLDLSPIRRFAVNTRIGVRFRPEALLSQPAEIVRINFSEFEGLYVAGETTCVAVRDGIMHGLTGWMENELAPGISFTNSPLAPGVDWVQTFFVVDPPVQLRAGDRVRASIQSHDGRVWRWKVQVQDESGSSKAAFDRSTWWSFPVTEEQMKRVRADFRPRLSRRGQAERYILDALNGQQTPEQLAECLQQRFADCFPTKVSASDFVGQVIERCA